MNSINFNIVLHAPSKWNLDYEDLTLITEDKVKIHAYLLQVKKMKRDSRLSVPFVRESLSKNVFIHVPKYCINDIDPDLSIHF